MLELKEEVKGVATTYPLSKFKQTIYFFPCEHIFNIEKV